VEATLHPDLVSLSFLLGTWEGEGAGEYPTVESFRYREESRFWHIATAVLLYAQRTWSLDDGRPMHGEMGFWRPRPNGGVELVLAHPTGIAEIEVGAVVGGRVELVSGSVTTTPSAKDVSRLERSLLVSDGTMTYDLRMTAVGVSSTRHLHAELRRTA